MPDRPSEPIDLRHAATDRALVVVVPSRRLLAIDGVGSPQADDYELATRTLRTVGEAIHGRLVRRHANVAGIGPIECAWWTHPEVPPDDVPTAFMDRSVWHWQQMLEVPSGATQDEIAASIDETRRAAAREQPLVRVIEIEEGRAAQILHVGSPKTESASIRKLYDAVAEAGLRPSGHLHQIMIADPRHVPLERARWILRLPVEMAAVERGVAPTG